MSNKERLDQHDRQIAGIRKLLKQGTQLVIGARLDISMLAKDIRQLAAFQKKTDEAQRRTEASLKAFIDTMRRGGNGHSKAKVDLQ